MNHSRHSLAPNAPATEEQPIDPRWAPAALLRGADTSVWRMERIKAIAQRQDEQGKTFYVEPKEPRSGFNFLHSVGFVLTALIAFAVYHVYVVLCCMRTPAQVLPVGTKRIVAAHGEWSTRTRHVLSQLPAAEPPIDAVFLLGRQNQRPEDIRAIWAAHLPSMPSIPIISALSLRAAWLSIGDAMALFKEGLAEINAIGHPLGLREEIAIAFRVYLGATQARWWKAQATSGPVEVLFSSTGTADTTLFEKAIQDTGGRTIHLVHGQAIGPNFTGYSDLALFKSAFDAESYDRLQCYGKCAVQRAEPPVPERGSSTVLVLTNLAHPMNDGFQRFGLRDEIAMLQLVRAATDLLSLHDIGLLWKPHPVTFDLPTDMVADLRAAAKNLGIDELPRETPLAEAAQTARWIITTPSTVAIELLVGGQLSMVIDPQRTVGSTALSAFPGLANLQPEALAELMAGMDQQATYDATFHDVCSSIGPARPLDLSVRLF